MALLPLQTPHPEEWAASFDRAPKLMPTWPDSQRIVIVVVVQNPDNGKTTGHVITTQADLDRAAHPLQPGRRLFFRVPRSAAEEICPELAD